MSLINDLNTLWLTHADTIVYWIDSTSKEITPKGGKFRGVKFTTETEDAEAPVLKTEIITDNGTIDINRIVEDKADIEIKIDEYLAALRTSIIADIPTTK